jgi:hypothetical protein
VLNFYSLLLITIYVSQLHYPVEIKLSRFVRSHLGRLGVICIHACVDASSGLFNGPRVIPPDSYVVVYHGKVSIATGADEEDAGFRTVEYTWQGKEYVVDSFDFASVSSTAHFVKDMLLTNGIYYFRKPSTS